MALKQLKRIEKLEQIIEKGAQVKSDVQSDEGVTNFNLRMPKKMYRQIDEHLKTTVGISKTGWILQTLHEKLKETL